MRKLAVRYLLLILTSVVLNKTVSSQVIITSTATLYTQNFNSLSQTGTSNTWSDNTTIPGWYSTQTTYIGDDGSSTTGGLHSYGPASNSDRALGLLSSSTTIFRYGVRIVNNTGGQITGLTISFREEQWRQTTNSQKLVFEYQVGASALTTGTWSPNTSFDVTALKTGTAGSVDGNASGNYSDISGTLNVTVENGQEIWLRWTKNGTTSPGLAIDDISIKAIAPISSNANLSNLTLSSGTLNPSFTSSTNNYTASVPNNISSITITPTSADGNSTITVNGVPVTSADQSSSIPLNVGDNAITTVVTAQDGITTKAYTVVVNRATASSPSLTVTSALSDFGNICINTTPGLNSFTIDGSNLDGSNASTISIAALPGFSYSENSGGPFANTLSFTYSGSSFTGKIIYVQFSPTAVQAYDGDITLTGGGVANFDVAAKGSGINSTPTVTTGSSSNVTATTGTVSGAINNTGCTSITVCGIEYSTSSGFPDGTGTKISASNLSGGNFSVNFSSLVPNTRYYYKAYATNSAGTTYGLQQAFNASPLPVPMASQPGLSYTEDFSDIDNWQNFFIVGNGANHFGGLSTNSTGTIPDGVKITTSTNSFSSGVSGGVQKGTTQTDANQSSTKSIVLLSTGATDNTSSAAIDFYMDFTGVNAGTLSFDWASVNNQSGDRNGSLRVYATTDGTTFTEITNVLNFTNNSPISGSKTNIPLPSSFSNNPNARLRFYYYNGIGGITPTGSRPKISIDNLTVTALATTPCSSPTAASTNLTFGTITDVSIQGSFTAASPASDHYLVIVSTNSSLTSNPVDGQLYNVGDNVGDGTVISNGTSTNFTATGLSATTTYYFFVFSFNGVCTGGPLYYTITVLSDQATTVAGLPPCAAPASQPSNLVFGTTTPSSIQASFTGTTADEYLVLKSTSSSLTNNPVDGQIYHVGDVIGNATVVQRNSATNFNATSLSPNTAYYFFIFSINSQGCVNGPVYATSSPLNGSQYTLPLPPCTTPTSQPSNLSFNASNTMVSGAFDSGTGADEYLVIRSTSPTLSQAPIDNNDYNTGDNLGGGVIVSNVTGNSFLASNLTTGTTYYFFVFAANKNCSGGTKYLTTNPLAASIATTNATTYNYYFGNLHSHSDYSDGNQDHHGYTPTDDYTYAMTAQCMDFLGISEHNHFSSPDNPGNTIGDYHLGPVEADNFTAAHPNFVALYGMEWGVISGGGHVVIYGDGMNNLWGWESGSGGWGPSNNYDVYVAKSDYTGPNGLFKTVNDNIGTNTFATLAHPNLADFNNIAGVAYNSVADDAITGAAVESGPATSTSTTYSNPGSSMYYLWYYETLLSKGYHLGPTIDHDNHNTTFGHTTYSRTAVVAPTLSKTEIIKAMRNMHFYATQDCDSKVDFTLNTKIMGSIFTDRYAPVISVNLSDATTNTSNAIIRVMFGLPGSGTLPVKIDSVIGNSLTFIDNNLANLSTGYYYIDISNGNSRIITAPVWYTRNDGSSAIILPVKLVNFNAAKENKTVKLTWSTTQEKNSKEFVIERSINGMDFQKIGTVATAGNTNSTINYQFMDVQPNSGDNFYRLRSVDIDNRYELSRVLKINFAKAYTFSITPNPASTNITITITNRTEPLKLQIADANGRIVRTQNISAQTTIIDVSNLSKGFYTVKITGSVASYTDKLIVQ